MNNFEFSTKSEHFGSEFRGREFYNEYKKAEFLQNIDNIHRILFQGYELRNLLRDKMPGDVVDITNMWLSTNLPVKVKKTGKDKTAKEVPINPFELTKNRLLGLVAAYAYDNRLKLPDIRSEEAHALGLTWDNMDAKKCKLYLSAVTGSEHFDDQFSYWPLVCALKKLQMKKIKEDDVLKIAKKKNRQDIRLGTLLKNNFEEAKWLWSLLPGDSNFEEFVNSVSGRFNVQF